MTLFADALERSDQLRIRAAQLCDSSISPNTDVRVLGLITALFEAGIPIPQDDTFESDVQRFSLCALVYAALEAEH